MKKGNNKASKAPVTETVITESQTETVVTEQPTEQKAEKITYLPMKGEPNFALGRPVDPNSARQKRLREMAERRAAGLVQRGRPIVEGSDRQIRLAELAAKKASGVTLERGRPVDPNSKRQHDLAEKAKRALARQEAAAKLQQPNADQA